MSFGVVGFLVLAQLAGRPAAQTDPASAALARSAELDKLGRWPEARAVVQSALLDCPAGDAGRSCRLRLTYALGYSFQVEAQGAESRAREVLLQRAVTSYQHVLSEAPGHAATIENLAAALRALGRDADVEQLLGEARDTVAPLAALLLGDSYRAQGRLDAAGAAYRRAALAAPDDPAPRERLVELYRLMPPDSAFTLYRSLSEEKNWEVAFPLAAIDGYELVVRRTGKLDVKTAMEACRRWLRLLAETGLLTDDRVGSLAKNWFTADLDGVRRYIADPKSLPSASPLLEDGNGELVGRLALALGREALGRGDAERAAAYWWGAYRQLGPWPAVSLDLAREVSTLDARYPKLDPTGERFRRIQNDLFGGKAGAYERADREAIQRYHTTLGLIYAQRRQWGSLGNPQSALFQLWHALDVARQREASERFFQPLPQVRARLAQGLAATGDTTRARVTYLDAAQAYLDADDPDGARKMLRRAAGLGAAGSETGRVAALQLVAAARERVAAPGGAPAGCDAAIAPVHESARQAGLDARFVARQRFKLLADCVAASPSGIASLDGARVLNAAVDDGVSLIGAGDLLRLDRAKAALLQAVELSGEPGRLEAGPPRSGNEKGTVLRLVMPGESRPAFLTVSEDAVLGARVVETLGRDTPAVRIGVRRGTVTLVRPTASAATDSVVTAKIRSVKGVTGVQGRANVKGATDARVKANVNSAAEVQGRVNVKDATPLQAAPKK